MFKQLFHSLAYATGLVSLSILPSFASLSKEFGTFDYSPKTMIVAQASSTLNSLLYEKGNILVQFQVEFLLSPKCPGTVSEGGELGSYDAAKNCLWDDSFLGSKTAKPDIYAILVEGNTPFPQRTDCQDTPSARCILVCPENQLNCQFTLLLNSQKAYSLFLGDKDLLVDDTAGIFAFYPSQLTEGSLILQDKEGRSVVKLSKANINPLDDCLFAIEALSSGSPNSANDQLKKAQDFLKLLINYLTKQQSSLPDFSTIQFIAGSCKPFADQVKPQTY
ncbi:hypothetical protein NIES3804_27470 [Microcystis aeruginosa NIES-3804]|uniref:Uncharacterized protein n=1 Tax=Microcystis aeruginosa NIES-3804 TaxID=2517783 RepID=A0A6H9GUC6_MICAE|nr:hypothetical protein [Microcystis aeruginosa]GCL51170.1 hypothetical protein NIES3804_27470 [Microcystis aeruginosa NIES-3804]